MYRELYKNEQYWIDKMMCADFAEKQIVSKQLLKAVVEAQQGYDFFTLKFKTQEIEKYPYSTRVPVEMRAFQTTSAPVIFLLHIVNGYIDELELITADSSKLDLENIELENVEYFIGANHI